MIGAFLQRGNRRGLDCDDAVGMARIGLQPSEMDRPDHAGLRDRGGARASPQASILDLRTTSSRLTLMGLCGEVRSVYARELLDYTNYVGDYENEMGIGFPPEHALPAGDPRDPDRCVGSDGSR